jgi:hypothetical protein
VNWNRLARRVVTWLLYTVLISLVPVAFLALILLEDSKLHGWSDILSSGELILIAVTMAAVAIGDLMLNKLEGPFSLGAIVNVWMAILVVFAGSLLYGRATIRIRSSLAEGAASAAQMTHTTLISAIIFVASCVVGMCTIAITTWEEGREPT